MHSKFHDLPIIQLSLFIYLFYKLHTHKANAPLWIHIRHLLDFACTLTFFSCCYPQLLSRGPPIPMLYPDPNTTNTSLNRRWGRTAGAARPWWRPASTSSRTTRTSSPSTRATSSTCRGRRTAAGGRARWAAGRAGSLATTSARSNPAVSYGAVGPWVDWLNGVFSISGLAWVLLLASAKILC